MAKNSHALLRDLDGKILIEPLVDFLSLGGSLKTKRKMTIRQEKESFAKGMAGEYLGKL